MKKKNIEKIERKRVNILISTSLLKELNIVLANKHGGVFGHVGKSIEEGLELWLKKEKLMLKVL